MDNARERFLRDRVLTATPGQRVVMLYDRLVLDLTRAAAADGVAMFEHTGHACKIVAELYGSLDMTAGGPVDNLAAIYAYLLKQLMAVRADGPGGQLTSALEIATTLRSAWAQAAGMAEVPAAGAPSAARSSAPALAGSWVG